MQNNLPEFDKLIFPEMATPLEVVDDRVQQVSDWVYDLVKGAKVPIE
jgi:hypothetical protein